MNMSIATTNLKQPIDWEQQASREAAIARAGDELRRWFGVEFSVWDARSGCLLHASSEQPRGDDLLLGGLVRPVVDETEPALLDEGDRVLLVGLPLPGPPRSQWVAVAAFVTRHVEATEDVSADARLLGLDQPAAARWINAQKVWDVEALMRLGSAVLAKGHAERKAARLEEEVEKLSDNLASTYEEISLLYGVTQNLRLTSTDEELGRLALDWLTECLPARGLAIQFLPVADEGTTSYVARTEPLLLTDGQCPLDGQTFSELVAALQPEVRRWPLVANRSVTASPRWRYRHVRQLILTPLCEGENVHGWLAALNHVDDGQFDSVHANLLTSVAAILGIHSGNHELYRQQAEFMADVVRALTSAIDAKDPYTCGHSDRVARISVRLARQLGCDDEKLNTIYMAGLLHDIGKIGINDTVLRKAGRLSEAEYEHIKLHPGLGHKILVDLKQFADVLPVVLHHHEQWDGGGYPHALAGNDIPYLARICAVADAYDAMTSDRPYRKGMPENKVDGILQRGSGQQWDPQIVDAFFAVREDVRQITRRERERLRFDVQQWT